MLLVEIRQPNNERTGGRIFVHEKLADDDWIIEWKPGQPNRTKSNLVRITMFVFAALRSSHQKNNDQRYYVRLHMDERKCRGREIVTGRKTQRTSRAHIWLHLGGQSHLISYGWQPNKYNTTHAWISVCFAWTYFFPSGHQLHIEIYA